MNREQIKQWGEEADAYANAIWETYEVGWDQDRDARFAQLAADHALEEAAKVCDKMGNPWRGSEDCASAIRLLKGTV